MSDRQTGTTGSRQLFKQITLTIRRGMIFSSFFSVRREEFHFRSVLSSLLRMGMRGFAVERRDRQNSIDLGASGGRRSRMFGQPTIRTLCGNLDPNSR